jgi:O-antigen/teichoic acid export membrane protein
MAMSGPRPLANVGAAPPARTLVKEGIPYLFSSAVSDVYGRLDAFLFLWLASFTAQGFYAVAVPAASLLLVGPDALALFSFNSGSRKGAPPSIGKVVAGGLLVIAFQAVVGCCFALVVGPLLVLLYGSRFDGALPFALALLPATALLGFAQVSEGYLRGRGKVRIGVAARLAASAVMVAIVLTIFSRFGELSIPIAASFAHGLVALTLAWFVLADVRGQHRAFSLPEPGDLLP